MSTTEPEVTVIVTPTPGARRRRLANRFRRMAEAIRRAWRRATGATKRAVTNTWHAAQTAGTTTVIWMKRGAGAVGRTVKGVGSSLYWSGAAVGRGIGRGARFLGRGAVTLVTATAQFLLASTAWAVRATSWVFRTVLESVFAVSFAAWLVVGVIALVLAFTHDKYEERVHSHARAWTGSKAAPKWGSVMGPVPARRMTGEAANEFANRVGPWEAGGAEVPTSTLVEEEEPGEGDIVVTKVESQTTTAPGPVREDLSDLTIGDVAYEVPQRLFEQHKQWTPWIGAFKESGVAPYTMSDHDMDNILKVMVLAHHLDSEGNPALPLRDYEPTADEYFKANSYWNGRLAAWKYWHDMMETDEEWAEGKDPAAYVGTLRVELQKAWAVRNREMKPMFDSREYHRQSFKQGWDNQVEWLYENGLFRIGFIESHATRDYKTGQPISV